MSSPQRGVLPPKATLEADPAALRPTPGRGSQLLLLLLRRRHQRCILEADTRGAVVVRRDGTGASGGGVRRLEGSDARGRPPPPTPPPWEASGRAAAAAVARSLRPPPPTACAARRSRRRRRHRTRCAYLSKNASVAERRDLEAHGASPQTPRPRDALTVAATDDAAPTVRSRKPASRGRRQDSRDPGRRLVQERVGAAGGPPSWDARGG